MDLSRISYFLMIYFLISHTSWTKTHMPTALKNTSDKCLRTSYFWCWSGALHHRSKLSIL